MPHWGHEVVDRSRSGGRRSFCIGRSGFGIGEATLASLSSACFDPLVGCFLRPAVAYGFFLQLCPNSGRRYFLGVVSDGSLAVPHPLVPRLPAGELVELVGVLVATPAGSPGMAGIQDQSAVPHAGTEGLPLQREPPAHSTANNHPDAGKTGVLLSVGRELAFCPQGISRLL